MCFWQLENIIVQLKIDFILKQVLFFVLQTYILFKQYGLCFFHFLDDMVLPLNHRQKINHSGSLIIQSVERLADEGEYNCMVRDPDGRSAASSTHVSVVGKF